MMAEREKIVSETVLLSDVFVVGKRRDVVPAAVETLKASIERLGLRTPITVRYDENIPDPETGEIMGGYALVAGRHRMEACKALGWERIPAVVRDCDEVEAELWEIAENLHRADLSKDERDRQIRRYAELLTKPEEGKPPQLAAVSGGRGNIGIATKIAAETGVSKDTVERALKPERVAAARARSQVDRDVKDRAAREVASILSEHVPGEWWDALKANLYAAGAANIANELTNITGQSIMDRRYAD